MKRTINILLIVITYILLAPFIIPLSISGFAVGINWIAKKLTDLFTFPLIFMEWVIVKFNK